MKLRAYIILLLMALVIAAPIVDAIACDDCRDVIPVQDMQQRSTNGADHADDNLLSDSGTSNSQRTATAQDLCPVCANIAAAMGAACCGAPFVISHTNHLPKLIAFSDPSYSIAKPPQN